MSAAKADWALSASECRACDKNCTPSRAYGMKLRSYYTVSGTVPLMKLVPSLEVRKAGPIPSTLQEGRFLHDQHALLRQSPHFLRAFLAHEPRDERSLAVYAILSSVITQRCTAFRSNSLMGANLYNPSLYCVYLVS